VPRLYVIHAGRGNQSAQPAGSDPRGQGEGKGRGFMERIARAGITGSWRLAAGLALALGLAACAPVMRFHGYAPSDADLAQIEVGRDTRETVEQKIGRPGMGGVLEGSDWFYVQSDWRERPLRAPVELRREVVAISFDPRGTVRNVERFGLQDGEAVALSARVTDTGPRCPGFLQTLGRAVGQVGPGLFR
jgi:outer membrane protein assembly factor BamE (lipoprotein component of BamABCDE complex)